MNNIIKQIRLWSEEIVRDALRKEYGDENFINNDYILNAGRSGAFHVIADEEYDMKLIKSKFKSKDDVKDTEGIRLELAVARTLIEDGTWDKNPEKINNKYCLELGFHHKKSYEEYKGILGEHEILIATECETKRFRKCKDSIFIRKVTNSYEDDMNKLFDKGASWDKEVTYYVKTKGEK